MIHSIRTNQRRLPPLFKPDVQISRIRLTQGLVARRHAPTDVDLADGLRRYRRVR
jgi:hypothetical protein